jgi:hypothetical protein
MKKRILFIAIAALLLSPWPVAYAYDNEPGSIDGVNIQASSPESQPKLIVFDNAIGGVTSGDLFTVDTSDSDRDVDFSLLLTNTDDLVRRYRYMTLNVGAFVETAAGEWEKTVLGIDSQTPEAYITLQNGMVKFTLPGGSKYRITINRGCFNAYRAPESNISASPSFYLSAS